MGHVVGGGRRQGNLGGSASAVEVVEAAGGGEVALPVGGGCSASGAVDWNGVVAPVMFELAVEGLRAWYHFVRVQIWGIERMVREMRVLAGGVFGLVRCPFAWRVGMVHVGLSQAWNWWVLASGDVCGLKCARMISGGGVLGRLGGKGGGQDCGSNGGICLGIWSVHGDGMLVRAFCGVSDLVRVAGSAELLV